MGEYGFDYEDYGGGLGDILGKVHDLQKKKIASVQLYPDTFGLDSSVICKDCGKDYFTRVDEYIENMAKDELFRIFPEADFIGEESGESGSGSRFAWMIDPIDGTAVYKLGGDSYSSSIALLDRKDKKILLGSVYQPTRGALFSRLWYESPPNSYATLIGPHGIAPVPSASRCFAEWLGCSFGTSKYYPMHFKVKERLENVFSETDAPELKRSYAAKDARPASGSSNLFCCQIGAGGRHFALLYFQKPWDLAVGALYARDAGCPVVLLDDAGNVQDKDLEAEVASSGKDTLLNVGVFANEHVMDYVIGKFKSYEFDDFGFR